MPMHNPPHPGKSVYADCLEPLGLSITAGAKALGISRQALSSLVNGHTSITPEMAVRLAKAFGSTADTWIRLQAAWEIAQVRKWADEIKVERYERRSA